MEIPLGPGQEESSGEKLVENGKSPKKEGAIRSKEKQRDHTFVR